MYSLTDAENHGQLDLFMVIYSIARGLQYLLEDSPGMIVHRNLKPQNVLLDSEFKPKISDFGFGKIFVSNQSQDMTQTQAKPGKSLATSNRIIPISDSLVTFVVM